MFRLQRNEAMRREPFGSNIDITNSKCVTWPQANFTCLVTIRYTTPTYMTLP